MPLPPIYELGFATAMYGLLLYIIYVGVRQYYYVHFQQRSVRNTLVWLGAFGMVLGIIAFLNKYRQAMSMIEEAGDISPALVAGAISGAITYLILGLVILGVSFLFKHLNQ